MYVRVTSVDLCNETTGFQSFILLINFPRKYSVTNTVYIYKVQCIRVINNTREKRNQMKR